eukprot:7212106-Pyramimonas_sp.AAC.1
MAHARGSFPAAGSRPFTSLRSRPEWRHGRQLWTRTPGHRLGGSRHPCSARGLDPLASAELDAPNY